MGIAIHTCRRGKAPPLDALNNRGPTLHTLVWWGFLFIELQNPEELLTRSGGSTQGAEISSIPLRIAVQGLCMSNTRQTRPAPSP